ncbi:MAG: glycine dehydrogenase (aminomethyl-transferring) [Myxococcales bacterium]|nr:glycine dehydrogenase (aminomethyl-transferring) [Myxococcales bacterium]
MEKRPDLSLLAPLDRFPERHLGPSAKDEREMLAALNLPSTDALIDKTIPKGIRLSRRLDLGDGQTEAALLDELEVIASKNRVLRSFIGQGYHDCITPGVILRNVLENPGWYTQYTPYQAEIAQGRMEMLLNFQTLASELTGLPVANASLLDEATAAAEAMSLCHRMRSSDAVGQAFFVDRSCHPQTIAVVLGRAEALGLDVVVDDFRTLDFDRGYFGVLVQFPTTDGVVHDYAPFADRAHAAGAKVVIAADPLCLTLYVPPGEMGADVAIGSTQRLGVPMGFGGPHAAYMTTTDAFKRQIPGRVIGLSKDTHGNPALRLSLQTREQHIRRDKATSNICTAQVLLAVVAAAYACWHGPEGLTAIAERVRRLTAYLREGLIRGGLTVSNASAIFDTVCVRPQTSVEAVLREAVKAGFNLRDFGDGRLGITFDETVTAAEVSKVLEVFGVDARLETLTLPDSDEALARTSTFLTHPVFQKHRSETEMLRYLARLESRDLSLVQSMIPLGSCTMKLNATTEMRPVTWPAFGRLHPFAPVDQTLGYRELFAQLEGFLSEITGFDAVSLQPNAGSQGEYAGLLVIRAWHRARGQSHRNICLIPVSAHGTNPATASMAGMDVVVVKCDALGNVDLVDLEAKARTHADRLAALMITYPSTHGVFEEGIVRICQLIHEHGGQVYMDGANMNAQVALCRPGDIGADVCHLNLHKTFCIPHGGGGPGMGPIGVRAHLAPFLPGHPVVPGVGGAQAIPAVSAAPWGSPSILTIPWAYIRMMGTTGLERATHLAILNANYMAARLTEAYPVLYRGAQGYVAHECIIDLRDLKASAGIEVDDVAKRLMDYGFHAPTMSFPVPGTFMIEPTESESKAEMDRFCDAMLSIREEIRRIERGEWPRDDNPLKHAPHTAAAVTAETWTHPYSRTVAAFPAPSTRDFKFWPSVGRVDNAYGDRNLICTCPPLDASDA